MKRYAPLLASAVVAALAMPALAVQAALTAPAALPPDFFNNPLVQSPLVLVAVQVLKMLPVPFEGKTLAGIVAALTIATVIIKVAIAVLTHTVDQLDVASLWADLYAAGVTLFGAAGIYSLAKMLPRKTAE